MEESERYKNNLERWQSFCPQGAKVMPFVDCIHLSLCSNENGELNLRTKKKILNSFIRQKAQPKRLGFGFLR